MAVLFRGTSTYRIQESTNAQAGNRQKEQVTREHGCATLPHLLKCFPYERTTQETARKSELPVNMAVLLYLNCCSFPELDTNRPPWLGPTLLPSNLDNAKRPAEGFGDMTADSGHSFLKKCFNMFLCHFLETQYPVPSSSAESRRTWSWCRRLSWTLPQATGWWVVSRPLGPKCYKHILRRCVDAPAASKPHCFLKHN